MNAEVARKAVWKDTKPVAEDAPALWNPSAAACWSLLFTPVFGAALHMHNWRALGDEEKAAQAKFWMIGSLVVSVAMVIISLVMPESKKLDSLQRSVGTGLLVAWYFTAARVQQKEVKERFGKDYPHRGWGRPIGAALLAVLGMFGVLFILALFGAL